MSIILKHSIDSIYCIVVIVLLFSVSSVNANRLDSLEQLLVVEKDVAVKTSILEDLSWGYLYVDSDKALEYILVHNQLVRKHKDYKGICINHNLLGVFNALAGKNTVAINFFETSYAYAKAGGLEDYLMNLGNNLALMYLERGEHDRAMEYHHESYESAKSLGDSLKMHLFLANIAFDLYQVERYEEALDYLAQTEELQSYVEEKTAENNTIWNQIGIVYETYFNIYKISGKKKKAKTFAKKAIEVYERSFNNYNLIFTYLSQADLYEADNDYAKAVAIYEKAITIGTDGDFEIPLMNVYIEYAKFLYAKGEAQAALIYAEKVLEMNVGEEAGAKRAEALDIVSKVHYLLGDFQEAYAYRQSHNEVRDSLLVYKRRNEIANVDYRKELARKKKENDILLAEQKANQALLRKDSFLMVSILCAVGIFGVLTVFVFRLRKYRLERSIRLNKLIHKRVAQLEKQNKHLASTKSDLERFAYITSHDLKEPLRNIGGFLGLIQRRNKDVLEGKTVQLMDGIMGRVSEMESLIEDTLSFYGVGDANFSTTKVNLNELIVEIQEENSHLMNSKHVKILHADMPIINANRFQLKILLKNLILNGVLYNDSVPSIVEVACSEFRDEYIINIIDNGIGMEAKDCVEVFTLFKRLEKQKEVNGVGVGLAICKKIVEKNNGQISITSEIDLGTTVKITIPKKRNSARKLQIKDSKQLINNL